EIFTFEDVSIEFSQDEWNYLDFAEKALYGDVMLETYSNMASIEFKSNFIYLCKKAVFPEECKETLDYNTHHFFQYDKKQEKLYINNQNEERQYNYKECGKSFNRCLYLTSNKRINSKEVYKCKNCDKSFPHHAHLQAHQRIHTGDKPYRCQDCGKSFTTVFNLHTHHRIHTASLPMPDSLVSLPEDSSVPLGTGMVMPEEVTHSND
ncbi:hypothetical protein U0070_009152, partial [Myodes glareolus]